MHLNFNYQIVSHTDFVTLSQFHLAQKVANASQVQSKCKSPAPDDTKQLP